MGNDLARVGILAGVGSRGSESPEHSRVRAAASIPSTVSRVAYSGAVSSAPTVQELRISARLLLHLARQSRFEPRETVSDALTQAGMARALGRNQAAVSSALKRLVDGRALTVEREHVFHRRQRVKVYQLTPLGQDIVRHILASMGE